MYILISSSGYVMDIDDRGYIASSLELSKAIKYLSYESAEVDSLFTNCEIRSAEECEQIFNPKMKEIKLESFKDELEKLLLKYNAEFKVKESYTDSPKILVVNKNKEAIDLDDIVYQSYIK